jgi:hypothetical protein
MVSVFVAFSSVRSFVALAIAASNSATFFVSSDTSSVNFAMAAWSSSISKLTEDVSELTKNVAELDAAMAKATKLRTEEKATNTETITDSEEAQTAVAQALTVLKEFYAKAGEATAFVQKAEPEIFDSPYKGMGAECGGVVSLKPREVGFNHFEHADNATALSSHAFVWRIEDFWLSLLDKCRSFSSFGIKFLEHC